MVNKHKKFKKRAQTRICPACGSTEITIPPAGVDLAMSVRDICRKCRYRGNFPMIKIMEIAKFGNHLESTRRKTWPKSKAPNSRKK